MELKKNFDFRTRMAFFENFLITRFAFKSKRPFSKLIIGIAISGIALGLSVMICSVSIMNGFQSTIKNKLRGFSGDLVISLFSLNESPENDPFILESSKIVQMRKISGVESVSGFATKAGIISYKGDIEGIIFKGISTQNQLQFFTDRLISGFGLVLPRDSISSQVLLSNAIAKSLNIFVGDKITINFIQEPIRKRRLTVTGIYDLGMDELDKVYLVGDLRLIQRLNNWKSAQIGGLEINFKKEAPNLQIVDQLSKILPLRLRIFPINQIYPQLFDWLSLTEVNVKVIIILMLLVGGINMISALLIMILERTATIGILKAIGATNGQISKVFLGIASYLIIFGIALGDFLGIGFCYLQNKYHFIKLNQETYYMAYVPIQFSWYSTIALNLGTFSVCLIMILVPSILVGRINPVKAIRFR